jgi:alkylhydroperoxidase family enzyme
MIKPDPPPRIRPLDPTEFSPEAREMFDGWKAGAFKDSDQNPVLRTFAHHPRLAATFSALNIHLLSTSTLPLRQRQIAIMRTAWLCGATYMWSSHLRTSLRRGLPPELFEAIRNGPQDPAFSEFEAVILRATEELVQHHHVGDINWVALSAEWNEQQLLDFLFTVGTYVMVAGVMRSTGVQREQELLELAERYGAP